MLSFVLAAAFLLHGTVHDASGHVVPGARVTWNGSHSTAVASDGSFAIDPGVEWPEVLLVSAKGFGTRIVDVPHVTTTTTLEPIVLRAAATLNVDVDRHGERRPLEVFIGVDQDRREPRWIKSHRIESGRSRVAIPDLARGMYFVQLRGSEPLQQFTETAVVADGDVRTVRFDLVPRRLRARIVAGTKPVPNADVLFHNFDRQWKGTVRTDVNGRVDAALWQGGDFEVLVRRSAGATPVLRVATLHGGPQELTIVIPDHLVRGSIVDEDGHPLAGAEIVLRTQTDADRTASLRARSDANGSFAFDGISAGTGHQLHASMPGFLFSETMKIAVGDDQPIVPVRFVMRSGYPREVVVRWRDGSPIYAATILCVSNSTIRSRSYTEDRGRAAVATPLNSESVLYVIPRQGSIAVYHLPKPADDTTSAPVTITVPPPAASLRVATLTTNGAPVSDVSLLLRLNGEIIPPGVAEELAKQNGTKLQTAEDGKTLLDHIPVGTYEFWPYRDDQELAGWMETVSAMTAPITVKVVAGENTAQVRFQTRIQ